MSNIVIGILGTDEKTNDKEYQAITKNNLKYLNHKCSYIGLISYDNYDTIDIDALKLCDGIIIPGGSILYPYHYQVLNYAYENNIPVLGICMGHQLIGLYSSNSEEDYLDKVDNHYSLKKEHHLVNFKEGSLLKEIFGSSIMVNSRHYYKLKEVNEPFVITGTSEDGVIESIEYITDKHFIIGVQWHPEDLDNMNNLYNVFLKEVLVRKLKK